jgi:hypothetical protein
MKALLTNGRPNALAILLVMGTAILLLIKRRNKITSTKPLQFDRFHSPWTLPDFTKKATKADQEQVYQFTKYLQTASYRKTKSNLTQKDVKRSLKTYSSIDTEEGTKCIWFSSHGGVRNGEVIIYSSWYDTLFNCYASYW